MAGRVAFILSSKFSGSTWLALMLGSHSAAFYAGELYQLYSSGRTQGCAFCADQGRACPYFTGMAAVARADVHAALLEKTGASLLVDNSKRVKWASHFVDESRFERKYVHLIRDPRGVCCSLVLRGRGPDIAQWAARNLQIREFLQNARLDSVVVTYDELSARLDERLPGMCRWLGVDFEPGQTEYWNFEHHGPGSGAATTAFFEGRERADREFYTEHHRTNFADLRWQSRLSPELRREIETHPDVIHLLKAAGLAFSDSGLVRVEAPTGVAV
jgi:hypothetical protein